jgi:hypothetical protein
MSASRPSGSGATELVAPEEFVEVLCADPELVRAEFEAIVAAAWPQPPRCRAVVGTQPVRPGHGPMPPRARARGIQPSAPCRRAARWARQRSPPRDPTTPTPLAAGPVLPSAPGPRPRHQGGGQPCNPPTPMRLSASRRTPPRQRSLTPIDSWYADTTPTRAASALPTTLPRTRGGVTWRGSSTRTPSCATPTAEPATTVSAAHRGRPAGRGPGRPPWGLGCLPQMRSHRSRPARSTGGAHRDLRRFRHRSSGSPVSSILYT